MYVVIVRICYIINLYISCDGLFVMLNKIGFYCKEYLIYIIFFLK